MAEAGCCRLLRVSCRAHQQLGAERVPLSRGLPMATQSSTAQPKGRLHVETDEEAGGRLAPTAQNPSSLAASAVCRQAPEVGAVCGSPARTDLCGGRSVTSVPTAIGRCFRARTRAVAGAKLVRFA